MTKARKLEISLRKRGMITNYQIRESKTISILTAQLTNEDILHAVFNEKTNQPSKIWTDNQTLTKQEVINEKN